MSLVGRHCRNRGSARQLGRVLGKAIPSPRRRGTYPGVFIERSFAAEGGGEVRLTSAPTGLTCRLEAPLASMQETGDEAAV
ncbi:hypothetical protein [Methylorubrum extorquens]|uniref:hypothetical protein n=1 Tax=Methylorubrum extorquens TaxID=408 RepID=UPI001300D394|nr:hypothetical protein [Methylorubrum extorquens]